MLRFTRLIMLCNGAWLFDWPINKYFNQDLYSHLGRNSWCCGYRSRDGLNARYRYISSPAVLVWYSLHAAINMYEWKRSGFDTAHDYAIRRDSRGNISVVSMKPGVEGAIPVVFGHRNVIFFAASMTSLYFINSTSGCPLETDYSHFNLSHHSPHIKDICLFW